MSEKIKKVLKFVGVILGIALLIVWCTYSRGVWGIFIEFGFILAYAIPLLWFCVKKFMGRKKEPKLSEKSSMTTKSKGKKVLSVFWLIVLYVIMSCAIISAIIWLLFTFMCVCPSSNMCWYVILPLLVIFILLTIFKKKLIYLLITQAIIAGISLGIFITKFSSCGYCVGKQAGIDEEMVEDTFPEKVCRISKVDASIELDGVLIERDNMTNCVHVKSARVDKIWNINDKLSYHTADDEGNVVSILTNGDGLVHISVFSDSLVVSGEPNDPETIKNFEAQLNNEYVL